jgi:rhamnose transport system permease protein
MLTTHRREVSVAAAIVTLAALLAVAAPGYFSRENLSDLFLASLPVLIVALGATLVILTGEIDISVGSVFAICGVLAGVSAKAGVLATYVPTELVTTTFASLAASTGRSSRTSGCHQSWSPSRRWSPARCTEVDDGGRVGAGPANSVPVVRPVADRLSDSRAPRVRWPAGADGVGFRKSCGRPRIYATGSNPDAARLAGFDTSRVKWAVFTTAGALTGLAAVLNSVRFNQIPSNAGLGLEMKVVAAVFVGGTAIRGDAERSPARCWASSCSARSVRPSRFSA